MLTAKHLPRIENRKFREQESDERVYNFSSGLLGFLFFWSREIYVGRCPDA